jgi:hypothetical protein
MLACLLACYEEISEGEEEVMTLPYVVIIHFILFRRVHKIADSSR